MTRHLLITGLVQGVGYRAGFASRARALGLSGWVRNRFDGSVEAVVQGDDASVEQIIAWARRGPAGARVADVRVIEAADQEPRDFSILPTA
jgi:acylphosphatase